MVWYAVSSKEEHHHSIIFCSEYYLFLFPAIASIDITHVWRENLAGIKSGDFSQNGVFLNLAGFKFGDSVPQRMSRGRKV